MALDQVSSLLAGLEELLSVEMRVGRLQGSEPLHGRSGGGSPGVLQIRVAEEVRGERGG